MGDGRNSESEHGRDEPAAAAAEEEEEVAPATTQDELPVSCLPRCLPHGSLGRAPAAEARNSGESANQGPRAAAE